MPMDGKVDAGHCGALNLPEWSSSMPKVGGGRLGAGKGLPGFSFICSTGLYQVFFVGISSSRIAWQEGQGTKMCP